MASCPVRPGDLTFAHVQALVDDLATVSEEEIAAAVKWLFDHANVVAEPSGAVSVAGGAPRAACRCRGGRRHLGWQCGAPRITRDTSRLVSRHHHRDLTPGAGALLRFRTRRT